MQDIKDKLEILDGHLADQTFVASESVTAADIALVCALYNVFDSNLQKKFVNAGRWFVTCIEQTNFAQILGVSNKVLASVEISKPADTQGNSFDCIGPLKLFNRGRIRVKELLQAGLNVEGKSVNIKGWAKTLREQGAGTFAFLEINDGSCFSGVQVIINKDETDGFDEALKCGGVGASFSVVGTVVKSPAKGQVIEVKAQSVKVYGNVVDKAKYPMSKKRHTLEHLRTNAHLRPRSNIHGAAMRVRNAMAFATHKFFNESGFLYIHTPLITASDCNFRRRSFS